MAINEAHFKIFAGSSHPKLAEEISKHLDVELGQIELKRFASNETYVRSLDSVRGKEVFIVQTATQNINDDYMELFLMCNAFKQAFAKKIHVIFPYYGYARQDRVSEPREPISAKLMADLITTAGADHVITFNLHCDQIQGFFDIPVDNIRTNKLFGDYFKEKNISDPVVVSPDAGGAKAAKKLADRIGAPLAILHKNRPAHNVSEVTHTVGDVSGKTAIIVDDMIDTGGSVCAAKEALIRDGANEDVYLAATHAVFSGPAVERLNAANFKEIVVTDSIPDKSADISSLKVLSIAPLLSDIIKGILKDESVSQLYLK